MDEPRAGIRPLGLLLAFVMGAWTLSGCATSQLSGQDWRQYKQRFITGDGRVHDTAHGGNTHSEAQGFGMLLAEGFGDRATFDAIWSWTRRHMQIRGKDHLLAWNWSEQQGRVSDRNNATDGDMLVAWALLRAADRWPDGDYQKPARALLNDIRRILIVGNPPVLLPGAYGFEDARRGRRLNLSYWIFPALKDFSRRFPEQKEWRRLYASGLELVRKARYGRWSLAPDWLWLRHGRLRPDGSPPMFSFDAMRVPLYLAWAGERKELKPYARFWSEFNWIEVGPERVNLESDWVRLGGQFQGARAIDALVRRALGDKGAPPAIPWRNIHYYEASLCLLARLAQNELPR